MGKFFSKIISFFTGLVRRVTKVNKYAVTLIIFFILTFCIGDSTLFKRYAYDQEINKLEKEIEHYKKLKDENAEKLKSLQNDSESLEKFAREQFQMIKPNEDLFIIVP